MNKATKKELGIGIFFALLSIFYIVASRSISTFTPFGNRGLDSRSIPAMIGWLSMALSLLYIVTTLLNEKRQKADAQSADKSESEVCDSDNVACIEAPSGTKLAKIAKVLPTKLLLSLLFLFFYFFFYQRAGFILASTGYLLAQSLLLTEKGKRKRWSLFLVLFSIGSTLIIYILFTKYLTLFLPRGILG